MTLDEGTGDALLTAIAQAAQQEPPVPAPLPQPVVLIVREQGFVVEYRIGGQIG